MKEANQFEDWTNQMMEGTWALVDTEEEIKMLKDLLAKPLPCGPDGEYATEQLYDLIGDDQLFDEISDLADAEGADADCREIVKARAEELGIDVGEIDHNVYGESINENPTDQETASSYQAGQSAAAAGKQRSLEMGMGGQDVVKTAGGSDVEEGIDSFVNPMDQDGTDPEKAVDPMADDDLDPEDITEDDNDYMSADELKNELIADLNHLYDQASTNDFTDNDHILDEMGDYFKDMHVNADDVVLDVYKMARDLVDAEPAEVIQFAEKGIKALGGIIEDAAMSDMRRLSGQVVEKKHVKKETQDVDTGKQALKAERDPMLERMLNIVNR